MDGWFGYGLIGLFTSAFLAATILPFSSEVLLFLLIRQSGNWLEPLAAASAGNILGSVLNYYLGYFGEDFLFYKLFRLNRKTVEKASLRFRRYGVYSLLFAWVPVVGDPLTVVAGAFKVRLFLFLVLVSIGKIARYGILVLLFHA